MASYESYVICTTPRSGSTLLCKLLSGTGKSGNPDSWFHTPSVERWIHSYLDSSPANFATPREALPAVFQAVRKCGTNDTGIFGLRLQRERFGFFMQQASIVYPELTNDRERFQAAFGKTLFIYLHRQGALDQALSYIKATQTGLWHIAPDGTELERLSAPQEPVYNADDITARLKTVNAENAEWEQWFEREGIAPLRITYEELSEDPKAVLVRIFDSLELNLDPGYKPEPGVAKLADAISRDWKKRYLLEAGVK